MPEFWSGSLKSLFKIEPASEAGNWLMFTVTLGGLSVSSLDLNFE